MRKVAVALLVGLAACTPTSSTTSRATHPSTAPSSTAATVPITTTTSTTYPLAQPAEETLRIAVWQEPENDWSAPRLLPASLWRVHQPSGMIIPLLATDPEPSPAAPDGDRWVIEVPLREGVTWSDGVPVTAADIVFTAGHVGWAAAVEIIDSGVRLTFSDQPGWIGFMTEIGLVPLLPAHYWQPLIEKGIDPGSSPEHDMQAPTAAGYRYVSGTERTISLKAVADWWDRDATYETYEDGVRWVNPTLGFDETYGTAGGERAAVQRNGPFIQSVEYRIFKTASDALLRMQSGELDLALASAVWIGLRTQWSGNQVLFDRTTFVLNTTSTRTMVAFDQVAEPAVRRAVICMVDVEFLQDNVLQGSAGRFEPPGATLGDPCAEHKGPGLESDEAARLEVAASILERAGWSWNRPPTDPFPGPNDRIPVLYDPSGDSPIPSTITAEQPAVDPLQATSALWIQQWSMALGIPVQAIDPDGEPFVAPGKPNLIDLPRFGVLLQTEPSTFPDLAVVRILAEVGTPWSDLADAHLRRIQAAPDRDAYGQAVADFYQAVLGGNVILPLYRGTRQDLFHNRIVLPYTEAVDGFEHIEQVLEAIRIEK